MEFELEAHAAAAKRRGIGVAATHAGAVAGECAHEKIKRGGNCSCWTLRRRPLLTAVLAVALLLVAAARTQIAPSVQQPRPSPRIPPLVDFACPNYSPTFPSRGGADCPAECVAPGARSVAAGYFNVFPASFSARVTDVGALIQSMGPRDATTYVEGAGAHAFMDSHVTFAYYCCQTAAERASIRGILESWQWPAITVQFSHATCAIDGPSLDHVSLILMLDAASNARVYREVERLEAAIRAAGVRLNAVRREQEPYHTTLAVVNGSVYPVGAALAAVNARFPPSSWEAVVLRRPCEAHGTTEAGFFC